MTNIPNTPLYLHPKGVKTYIEMVEGENGLDQIQILRKYLKEGSALLEIGMGAGNDLSILGRYYQVTGSDYSDLFLEEYKKTGAIIQLINLNAVTLSTDNKFDGLFSNKVLHHLSIEELKESIINQHRILNDTGIICHSFWKGSKKDESDGLLFNHYYEDEIELLFKPKFNIIYLESYGVFNHGESILLIASRK